MPGTEQSNRRISRRAKTRASIKFICRKGTMDMGHNLAVAVLDLSETGVRLVVKSAPALHETVTITLEGIGPRPVRRTGTVAWCMETAEQTFAVGIRFDKRLAYVEWQSMT